MSVVHTVIHWLAGAGALANAFLFIPQIIKLMRSRSAEGVSISMYAGFLLLQLVTGADLLFHRVWTLAFGMAASTVATSTIILLCLKYRRR